MSCGCSQNKNTRSIIKSITMGGKYMNPIGRNVTMKRGYSRKHNMRTRRRHLLSNMNIINPFSSR